MPRHPDTPDALITNVTQWLCPEDQFGRPHHLVPDAYLMVCRYCHKTRNQIEEDNLAEDREAATVRDAAGRDSRIHGLVLDGGNPARTLRELLRQWVEEMTKGRSQNDWMFETSLYKQSVEALKHVDVDGRVS